MSRPLRIQYEGAWYHAMNRGAAKKTIFYTNAHRLLFLKLLGDISRIYKIEIHSYCLMTNHYHLLLRTPLANLSHAMRHLNGVYTQYFNLDRETDGPLFRGRYKAILVEDDAYLLKLSRYIHLNPVEAGLSKNPEDYYWSSCRYYSFNHKIPAWLHLNNILSRLGDDNLPEAYQAYVMEGVDAQTKQFFEKTKQLPVMGSKKFIKTIKKVFFAETQLSPEISDHKKLNKIFLPSPQYIIEAIIDYYQIDNTELITTQRGKTNIYKLIAIYLVINHCHLPLSRLAHAFQMKNRSGLSNSFKRFSKRLENTPSLKKDVAELTKRIHSKGQGAT